MPLRRVFHRQRHRNASGPLWFPSAKMCHAHHEAVSRATPHRHALARESGSPIRSRACWSEDKLAQQARKPRAEHVRVSAAPRRALHLHRRPDPRLRPRPRLQHRVVGSIFPQQARGPSSPPSLLPLLGRCRNWLILDREQGDGDHGPRTTRAVERRSRRACLDIASAPRC